MGNEGKVRASIGMLMIPAIEFTQNAGKPPKAEEILPSLCHPGESDDTESIVERYREISANPSLMIMPDHPEMLEKMFWPLRDAKVSYVLGNYLGVIALCGMVAEMVAMLMWRLADVRLNDKALAEDEEPALLGSRFERLRQDRRVKVLSVYGIVSQDVVENFETIRSKRRQYLHLLSQSHDSLREDAESCFRAATDLVVAVISPDAKEGKLLLRPRLLEYLLREGVYKPSPASASSQS